MINLAVTVVAIVLCSILLAQISVQTTPAQLPLIPLVSTREHLRLDSGELEDTIKISTIQQITHI